MSDCAAVQSRPGGTRTVGPLESLNRAIAYLRPSPVRRPRGRQGIDVMLSLHISAPQAVTSSRSLFHPMLLRAVLAFVCLPGIIAFAVPVALGLRWGDSVRYPLPGSLLVGAGTLLLLACVREFYVAGRG